MITAVKDASDKVRSLTAGSGDAEAMKAGAKSCGRLLDELDRKFSNREAMIMGVK